MNNLNDSKLTTPPHYYIICPPTLKKLASQQIAVMNYKCQVADHRYDFTCDNEDHCKMRYRRLDWSSGLSGWDFKIKDKLGVNADFLENIFESNVICAVGHSIDVWIERNFQNVFFDSKRGTDILNCLEDLVLKPDGTVCYLNTAKKLLMNDKLSTVEKFRFACANCLVEDIENLWPLVSDNPLVTKCNCQIPMIDYWKLLMRGEPLQLSGADADLVERRDFILERSEWPANEYVFDMLTENEQIEAAVLLIHYKTDIYIERIFLKLNQNANVMREVMKKIDLRTVMDNLVNVQYLIPKVWNFVKHFITKDDFIGVICEWNYPCSFLSEMWASAPDYLKQSIISNVEDVKAIFHHLNSSFYEESTKKFTEDDWYYDDMSFFATLLSNLPFELRNSLWHKYWRNLIVCSSPDFLNEVMKLCFDNDDEIIRFKKCEMMNLDNIEDFCFASIRFGYTKELSVFLNFCSTDVDHIFVLKQKIIASPRVQSYFVERRITQKKFIAFDQFIDSAFIDKNNAKKYKNKLIVSSVKLQKLYDEIDKEKIGVPWM